MHDVHQASRERTEPGVTGTRRPGSADLPVDAHRSALLVIDMQREFVQERLSPYWVPDATRIVPRVVDLVTSCRSLGVPVIYTVFADTHDRWDRPRALSRMPIAEPSWTAPPEAAEIWPPLAAEDGDVVIRKPSYGAFYDTPLDTILRRQERDTVIVCGTLTNFCVGTTVRQAYERSYYAVVAEDATASDDAELHAAELATLRKGFALVLPTAEIIGRLGGRPASAAAFERA
jgi:nicotinamidase-related amidase